MTTPYIGTGSLTSDLMSIIKSNDVVAFRNYIAQNKLLAGCAYKADSGEDWSFLSYVLVHGSLEMAEVFADVPLHLWNEQVSGGGFKSAMMSTQLPLSHKFLSKAFNWLEDRDVQVYLCNSVVSQETWVSNLHRVSFQKAFDVCAKTDNKELLVELFKMPQSREKLKKYLAAPEDTKNLWEICIQNYAFVCEAYLKQVVAEVRKEIN